MKKLTLLALMLSAVGYNAIAQPPVTSGLRLYLDAAIGYNANGAAAAVWQDQSGNGNHVTAVNPTTGEPTLVANALSTGFPAVQFNGTGNTMTRLAATTTGMNTTNASIFVVRMCNTRQNTIGDPTTPSSSSVPTTLSIGENNSFNNEFGLMADWTIHSSSSGNWARKDHQCYSSLPDNRPAITTGVLNTGVTNSDINYYVNGVLSTQSSVNQSSPWAYSSASRSIVVGGRFNGSSTATLQTNTYFNGYIFEVLAYDRLLSAAEIAQVHQYLKCKYNINYAACNAIVNCDELPPSGEQCSDKCYWKVDGNNIMNGNNKFGTNTKDDVLIRTSGIDHGIITSGASGDAGDDGRLGWQTLNPTAHLHVNCENGNPEDGSMGSDVRFEQLEHGQGNILVIDQEGYVYNSRMRLNEDGGIEPSDEFRKMYSDLQKEVEDLKMKLNQLLNVESDVVKPQSNTLLQNVPNPYGKETTIEYDVKSMTQSAYIVIFDVNGREIMKKSIDKAGKGRLTIDAQDMVSGMYMYSLVVDGKEIASKRMSLVK